MAKIKEFASESRKNDDFEALWNNFSQIPAPPMPSNFSSRFWHNFEMEFAEEEQQRQQLHEKKDFFSVSALSSFFPPLFAHPLRSLAFVTLIVASCFFVLRVFDAPSSLRHSHSRPSIAQQSPGKNSAFLDHPIELYSQIQLFKDMEFFEHFDEVRKISEKDGL